MVGLAAVDGLEVVVLEVLLDVLERDRGVEAADVEAVGVVLLVGLHGHGTCVCTVGERYSVCLL